jgi:uncharacterized protein (TIGR02757 family)
MKYEKRSEKPDAIKEFLDEQVLKYNNISFIEKDPISIPHSFTKKEDIEIAGFLAATIAWGNRKSILNNAQRLMNLMDLSPHQFVKHHSKKDLKPLEKFVHRTFNGEDCIFFMRSLKNIYNAHGGLESAFRSNDITGNIKNNISSFRQLFLETPHALRSEKHISDPSAKSPAKRICMFLRWMVRNDKKGVDFGLWKNIIPAQLCLPLDVHTGNVSRTMGLLKRKQNDWQAVEEITGILQQMDPLDPIKYDFALFGIGVNKAW